MAIATVIVNVECDCGFDCAAQDVEDLLTQLASSATTAEPPSPWKDAGGDGDGDEPMRLVVVDSSAY